MTRAGRALAGPGRARGRDRRPMGGRLTAVAMSLATVTLAMLLAACSAGPSSTASDGPTPTASAVSSAPRPNATSWPVQVVASSIALAAADSGFAVMAGDLSAALDSGEPARILDVTGRVLSFLQENQKNIPGLQAYGATKAVGDRLAAAYQQMIDGVVQIRDGLKSGDGAAVTAGFTAFFAGNTAYGDVRSALGDVASQAVFMKKGLLK